MRTPEPEPSSERIGTLLTAPKSKPGTPFCTPTRADVHSARAGHLIARAVRDRSRTRVIAFEIRQRDLQLLGKPQCRT